MENKPALERTGLLSVVQQEGFGATWEWTTVSYWHNDGSEKGIGVTIPTLSAPWRDHKNVPCSAILSLVDDTIDALGRTMLERGAGDVAIKYSPGVVRTPNEDGRTETVERVINCTLFNNQGNAFSHGTGPNRTWALVAAIVDAMGYTSDNVKSPVTES